MTIIEINPNAIYDLKAVSEILSISRQAITGLIKEGKLPKNKVANRYMWSGKQILEILEKK